MAVVSRGALVLLIGLLLAGPAGAQTPGRGWLLWHMLVVDRAYKWIPVEGPEPKAVCVAAAAKVAPYEKKHGPLVWYADLSQPSHWYGCWPDDWDPRTGE